MTRRHHAFAWAILALALTGVAESSRAGAPSPAKAVDMAKFYSGTWIEIGRHPMWLTNGCVAGATAYSIVGPLKVEVRDTCHTKTPDGPLQAIGGPARIIDPGTNAKLHVSYRLFGFWPVGRDYWVIDHDDDYQWFISSDPAFKNLWIYTRDPHVDPTLLKGLIGRAKALGYDTDGLEYPAQP